MYKTLIILLISSLFFCKNLKAKNYAILVSAGQATTDDVFSNSEYWYDLFLAYEDLVLKEGYDPADVIVCYGDGTSFNSKYPRYQPSLHNWGNIVDRGNSCADIQDVCYKLGKVMTNDDNLLFRWVVGHGDMIQGNDDYAAYIQNWGSGAYLLEDEIMYMLNTNMPNYKRRKIMWMTCNSGCLAVGGLNLNNDRTVLITSSNWDQPSDAFRLSGETVHSHFRSCLS